MGVSIKKNVIWIFSANIYVVLSQLVLFSILVRYLNPDEFGLVGVFAVYTGLALMLDLGLSQTLTRVLAKADTKNQHHRHDLFISYESLMLIIVVFIILISVIISPTLAHYWISSESIPEKYLTICLGLMGVQTGFQVLSNFYIGGLQGLQWIKASNINLIIVQSFKFLTGLLTVVYFSGGIQAFLITQLIFTVLGSYLYRLVIIQAVKSETKGYVSQLSSTQLIEDTELGKKAIRENLSYTKGIAFISFCAFLITQTDKILLPKILTLQDYGIYAVLVNIGATLAGGAGLISRVILPKLIQSIEKENIQELQQFYLKTAKLVAWLICICSGLLCLFHHDFLNLYLGEKNNQQIELVFTLVLAAYTIHSLIYIPFTLSLAYGFSEQGVKSSIYSILLMIPLTIFMTSRHGMTGAALSWFIVTIFSFAFNITYLHSRYLKGICKSLFLAISAPAFLFFASLIISFLIKTT